MTERTGMTGALTRFFTRGLEDAEARVLAWTAPRPPVEPVVARLLESSAVVGAIKAALARVTAAVDGSWCRRLVMASRHSWTSLSLGMQRLRIGSAIALAAAVHVLLNLMQGPPPGWQWLVVPAIVATAGLLLAAAGAAERS